MFAAHRFIDTFEIRGNAAPGIVEARYVATVTGA
jgi:hypothetical protein